MNGNVAPLGQPPPSVAQRMNTEVQETDSTFLTFPLVNKRTRMKISKSAFDMKQYEGRSTQLFVVANTKGWWAAVTQENAQFQIVLNTLGHLQNQFRTVSSREETYEYQSARMVPLEGHVPNTLVFAAGDTRLVVGLLSGMVLVFDTAVLFTPGTGSLQPLHVFQSQIVTPLRILIANPGDTSELVAFLREANGNVMGQYVEIIDVVKMQSIGGWSSDSLETLPTTLSWSPKGKQIAVGLRSGSMITFEPAATMNFKSVIPPPPACEAAALNLIHTTWLSNPAFYTIFTAPVQGPDITLEHAVTAYDGKANTAAHTIFKNPPYYPFPALRSPSAFTLTLRGWEPTKLLLIVGDCASGDLGVLSCGMDDSWNKLTLEETSQPSLPLDIDMNDTTLVGLQLDTTSTQVYQLGELQLPPPPIMYVYASDGSLTAYSVVNSSGKPYGATASTLSPSTSFGAPAQPSAFGGSSTFGQPSSFGAQTSPSAFGAPKTTSAFGQPSFGAAPPVSAFGGSPSPQPSAFGQTSQPTSAFGQSSFGAPSTSASAFSGAKPVTTGGFSAFAGNQTSAFGQGAPATSSGFGGSTGAFGGAATTPAPSTGAFGSAVNTSAFGPSTGAFGGGAKTGAFGGTSTGAFGGAVNTSAFGASTGAFGSGAKSVSAFGQPSAFGQQAAPVSAFGQQAAAPATTSPVAGGFGAFAGAGSGKFGQPAGGSAFGGGGAFGGGASSEVPKSVFGGGSTSAFGGAPKSAFGGTASPSAFSQSPAFGQSSFGAPAAAQTIPPPITRDDSMSSTPVDSLSMGFGLGSTPTSDKHNSMFGPTPAAATAPTSAFGKPASSSFISPGSGAFGSSAPATGAFGASVLKPASAFGAFSNPPATPTTEMGSVSGPPTPTTAPQSAFGRPSAFGQPSFGQSSFGQSGFAAAKPATPAVASPPTSGGFGAFADKPASFSGGGGFASFANKPATLSSGEGSGFGGFASQPATLASPPVVKKEEEETKSVLSPPDAPKPVFSAPKSPPDTPKSTQDAPGTPYDSPRTAVGGSLPSTPSRESPESPGSSSDEGSDSPDAESSPRRERKGVSSGSSSQSGLKTNTNVLKPASGFGAFNNAPSPNSPFATPPKAAPVSAFGGGAGSTTPPPSTTPTTGSPAFGATSTLGGSVKSAFASPGAAKAMDAPKTGGFGAFSGGSPSGFAAFAGSQKSFGDLLKGPKRPEDAIDPVKPFVNAFGGSTSPVGTPTKDKSSIFGAASVSESPLSAALGKPKGGLFGSPPTPPKPKAKQPQTTTPESSPSKGGKERVPSSDSDESSGGSGSEDDDDDDESVRGEKAVKGAGKSTKALSGASSESSFVEVDEEDAEGDEDDDESFEGAVEDNTNDFLSDFSDGDPSDSEESGDERLPEASIPLPATPQPEDVTVIPSTSTTPVPQIKVEDEDSSTTPPGSPVKSPSEEPIVAPVPVAPGFGIGLGRPNTRPTRSSPLAGGSVVNHKPQPASPKSPFGMWSGPVKTEPESDAATRQKTPPLLSTFGKPTPPGAGPTSPLAPSPPFGSQGGGIFSKAPPQGPSPPTPGGIFSKAPEVKAGFFSKPPSVPSTSPVSSPSPPATWGAAPAKLPSPSMPPPGGLFGAKPSSPPVPAPAPVRVPAPAPPPKMEAPKVPSVEEGMQAQCLYMFNAMAKDLEDLRLLAEDAKRRRAELGRSSGGVRRKTDLSDITKWTLGDAVQFGQVTRQIEQDVKAVAEERAKHGEAVRQLEGTMVKAVTRKEEIVRFNAAKSNDEFSKMLKVRSLGPEHMEAQGQLRRDIRIMRDRVQKLEDHLQASKKKLNQVKLGKASLRAPSLDTINRTCRNIDLAIDQQQSDVGRLVSRMAKLDIEKTKQARHAVEERDPRLPASTGSKRPFNVTPHVAITTAAALNAERSSQKLKKALLAARAEPLLNMNVANAPPPPTDFVTPGKPAVAAGSGPPVEWEDSFNIDDHDEPAFSPEASYGVGRSHRGGGSGGHHARSAQLKHTPGSKPAAPPSTFDWGPMPTFNTTPTTSLPVQMKLGPSPSPSPTAPPPQAKLPSGFVKFASFGVGSSAPAPAPVAKSPIPPASVPNPTGFTGWGKPPSSGPTNPPVMLGGFAKPPPFTGWGGPAKPSNPPVAPAPIGPKPGWGAPPPAPVPGTSSPGLAPPTFSGWAKPALSGTSMPPPAAAPAQAGSFRAPTAPVAFSGWGAPKK